MVVARFLGKNKEKMSFFSFIFEKCIDKRSKLCYYNKAR